MRKYIFLAGTLALLLAGCGTSAPEQTEALTSIAAYPETMHLTVGSHEGIQVVLTPSDASEQELVWASSNKAVATVDEAGMVSALSQGTCTVTVASKAYSTVSAMWKSLWGRMAPLMPLITLAMLQKRRRSPTWRRPMPLRCTPPITCQSVKWRPWMESRFNLLSTRSMPKTAMSSRRGVFRATLVGCPGMWQCPMTHPACRCHPWTAVI